MIAATDGETTASSPWREKRVFDFPAVIVERNGAIAFAPMTAPEQQIGLHAAGNSMAMP